MIVSGPDGDLDVGPLIGRGWSLDGEALVRELTFRDFPEALRFVDRLAQSAVDYGRRPDVCISEGSVRLSVYNLHHAGLSLAELRLASKVDAVVDAGA